MRSPRSRTRRAARSWSASAAAPGERRYIATGVPQTPDDVSPERTGAAAAPLYPANFGEFPFHALVMLLCSSRYWNRRFV
jgi:hypothetical protein